MIFGLQVQTGGSFDIDYEVKDPQQKVILDGEKERQGDFVFTAQHAGEYSFCFSNDMSTFAEKIVDFEITVPAPPPHLYPFCIKPRGLLGQGLMWVGGT